MVCPYFQVFLVCGIMSFPFTKQLSVSWKAGIHVILILIKVHIFSLSQTSLVKCHLQQQVWGHGCTSSPEMRSCKQLFP